MNKNAKCIAISILTLLSLAVFVPASASAKRIIKSGDCGVDVQHVKEKLFTLKMLNSSEGNCLSNNDVNGVIAFQKWKGLARDGIIGKNTRNAMKKAKYFPKSKSHKKKIVINLEKQLMVLYKKGKAVKVISVSTGMSGYDTPKGSYKVFRKERMSWSNPYSTWMPWASYFNGGIAMHEGIVPPYPASHGCVRVPSPFAKKVYEFASFGSSVFVK